MNEFSSSLQKKTQQCGNGGDEGEDDEFDFSFDYSAHSIEIIYTLKMNRDNYADSEGSVDGQSEAPVPPPQSLESRIDNDESIAPESERLFPTPQELAKLTPVDIKAALTLYVQNRNAMAEMLDGYAELVDTQMIPTLKTSLNTRNRGALMESLDFVARASEFVCARRVQVFVAKLLHAIAESDVGDFTSFQKEFDELMTEMQGAVNFIRFFLQTRAPRRKNKDK
ncbi:Hypothetical protein PHPALM_5617 [Phytophthora palmivora]|uniref:Uncharacterized protein n=1 Tax=Phytophthora palmivora TaxID=4796 RepID=A0A2P4YH65_9STRA|nr:Hypothetical protein PHPALM_5617 [Phytophthora palmivora]